jgi:hypothetical protein
VAYSIGISKTCGIGPSAELGDGFRFAAVDDGNNIPDAWGVR